MQDLLSTRLKELGQAVIKLKELGQAVIKLKELDQQLTRLKVLDQLFIRLKQLGSGNQVDKKRMVVVLIIRQANNRIQDRHFIR
jgi:hypothetical protein